MGKVKFPLLSFWTVGIMVLTLNIIVFGMMIITATHDLQVQYIPDDAYYYLTLAKNFSSLGVWTFDSGISVTSGFHPLFAYLLSSAFSFLQLNTNSFVTFGIALSLLCAIASIVILLVWGFKHQSILFLMFLALVISSQNFVYNTVSITEWSLTILFSLLYFVYFITKYKHQTIQLIDLFTLFLLGFLGSISRSDFGLLPASILFATFVISFNMTISKKQILFAFIGLLGTIFGLLAVFVHNYIFTNEILQSSAKMKAYWTQLGEPNYRAVPLLIGDFVGFTGLLLLAIFIAIALLARVIKQKNMQSNRNNRTNVFDLNQYISLETQNTLLPDSNQTLLITLVSVGVSVLGYTLVYSRNGAFQPWYTANLIVPFLMLVFGISDYIMVIFREKSRFLFSLLFLAIVIFNISNLYPVSTINSPWPHQKFMLDAGSYLKENAPNGRISAWNAGIIGYYEGGRVVNLDGLVNNDIYAYAVKNELPAYLIDKDIDYIIDFENMIFIKSLRVRGGYDDPEFYTNLTPQKVFDNGEYGWSHLTLYQIDK